MMGLHGFDESRREFLRARQTIDLSACPGSGKTTLIVAKLAILARKWPHRTKGICVLSHTNAAREEIQLRLRGTVVGQQLLSHPHFIDTIHGFVNRFLALPWLNSNGYPAATVDDDATNLYRRRSISIWEYEMVSSYLRRSHREFESVRLKDRELQVKLVNGDFPSKPGTATYEIAKKAVGKSSEAGYFCYDEMFVWAKALLEDCPSVSTWLQSRFPLVMVDEVQDTSALQMGIVEAVFPRANSAVALQRVGDPNQSIFDDSRAKTESLGGFPASSTHLEISKTFRFGPEIAKLASPFAVHAVGPGGLEGVGPRAVRGAPHSCQNAIFVFDPPEAKGVLNAYGLHVLSSFENEALAEGDVVAVGAVHKDASDVTVDHPHFPKTVSHYWSGYKAEVGRSDPHPGTLLQYVRVAQASVRDRGDLASAVQKLAAGLVRLARRRGGATSLGRRVPSHRSIVDALADNDAAASAYRRLLKTYLLDLEAPTIASWAQRQADILQVAAALDASGAAPEPNDHFLNSDPPDPLLASLAGAVPGDLGPNVYRVENATGRSVDIRLGSVHSVKGQTHLATLLLNTYRNGHSAKRMLPWLLGEKVNLAGAGVQDRARLQLTYVAMTRPSHLVCLAVPRDALGDDEAMSLRVASLRQRGWSVGEIKNGVSSWCA
ncbi:MAG: UvrD-helicase domain-containing protein [Rhodothermales bacterium]|nr:UvrD-helicase domain-containing protein [Rhodothermales bacterium]